MIGSVSICHGLLSRKCQELRGTNIVCYGQGEHHRLTQHFIVPLVTPHSVKPGARIVIEDTRQALTVILVDAATSIWYAIDVGCRRQNLLAVLYEEAGDLSFLKLGHNASVNSSASLFGQWIRSAYVNGFVVSTVLFGP